MKVKIGSALTNSQKIQRSVRVDPHKDVPFEEPRLFSNDDITWAVFTTIGLIIIVISAAVCYG